MFSFINMGSYRGVGMIVLQVLRVFTVIGLAAATAACWIMMVKVGKGKDYFVFEAASLFFLGLICVFLAVSEFPVIKFIKNFYRNSWPRFSDHHGLTWLGLTMLLIGCNLLGRLNQPAYDAKKIGEPFAQLVLASGILSITFGALNVVCSFAWKSRKDGVNARDVRSKGSLAKQHVLPDYSSVASPASSLRNEKTRSKFVSMFWKGGKDTEAPRTFDRSAISAPFNAHQQDVERDADDGQRGSPIVPGLKRPDTALHPMHTGRSSRYSEAHMSRF